MDEEEDKRGATGKDGSEKRIDDDDKAKTDWFCETRFEKKRFREGLSK